METETVGVSTQKANQLYAKYVDENFVQKNCLECSKLFDRYSLAEFEDFAMFKVYCASRVCIRLLLNNLIGGDKRK